MCGVVFGEYIINHFSSFCMCAYLWQSRRLPPWVPSCSCRKVSSIKVNCCATRVDTGFGLEKPYPLGIHFLHPLKCFCFCIATPWSIWKSNCSLAFTINPSGKHADGMLCACYVNTLEKVQNFPALSKFWRQL